MTVILKKQRHNYEEAPSSRFINGIFNSPGLNKAKATGTSDMPIMGNGS